MANDVRHLSIALLDILLFSFVKYLFKASAHFFTLDFCILSLTYRSSLYILYKSFCQINVLEIFSTSLGEIQSTNYGCCFLVCVCTCVPVCVQSKKFLPTSRLQIYSPIYLLLEAMSFYFLHLDLRVISTFSV